MASCVKCCSPGRLRDRKRRSPRRPIPLAADTTDSSELHEAAVRLLARREHAAEELVRKLVRRGFDADDARAEIRSLAEHNLQSDQRFAELYVEQRIARGDGPAKIRAALDERGVDSALIAEALEASGVDWLDQARRALERRFGPNRSGDWKTRGREARFLATRGFPSDIAARATDVDSEANE